MADSPNSSRRPGPVVWIAALAAAAAIGFLVHGLARGPGDFVEGPAPGSVEPTTPMASPGASPAAPSSPRELADRRFDRAMRTLAAGDTAAAAPLVAAAIETYENAGGLDADGMFHLALLREAAGDAPAARATAETVLEQHPDHLLHLGVLARVARDLGDTASARAARERFLAAYETERTRGRPEYEAHSALLPELKAEAEAGLDQ